MIQLLVVLLVKIIFFPFSEFFPTFAVASYMVNKDEYISKNQSRLV